MRDSSRSGRCEKCHVACQGRWCRDCYRGKRIGSTKPNEQTDAELDAIIEEQSKVLPKWWKSETGK